MDAGDRGMMRARIYHVGLRTYRVSLTGPKEMVASKDAEGFLNSFKLAK